MISITQLQAQDLLESYQLALKNNPTLKQAYFKKMAVSESKSQSIAQMLPSLSVTAKTAAEWLNNKKVTYQGSGTQSYYSHSLSIDLVQPVFHWGHWIELNLSDNKIAQAEAQYLAEEQLLILNVTEAYFNILAATADLDFSFSEQKAIKHQNQRAKVLFEEGWIAATDVYEAQAILDRAKASQIKAENAINDNIAKLVELTGGNDEVDVSTLIKDLKPVPPEPANIEKWQETAKNNNLSIIAALNATEVSRKTIDIQQSGHYPTLDIVGSYGFSDENSTFGFRGQARSIGLQLTIPLFEGGAVSSRTQQAAYNFQAAKEQLHQTQRKVNRQVKTHYRYVLSTLEQIKAFKSAVISSDKVLQAVEVGFETGKRTMMDLLNEQKNFYAAQRDYSHSLYDYILSGVKLKQISSSLTREDLVKINLLLEN